MRVKSILSGFTFTLFCTQILNVLLHHITLYVVDELFNPKRYISNRFTEAAGMFILFHTINCEYYWAIARKKNSVEIRPTRAQECDLKGSMKAQSVSKEFFRRFIL